MGGFARWGLGSGATVGAAGLVAGSVGRVPHCQRGRDGLRGFVVGRVPNLVILPALPPISAGSGA